MTEEELEKLSMEAKLLLAGGKYWEKKGKRIYLSDIVSKIFDIEVKRYHTGNISEIYINGEKWGNCRGKRVLDAISYPFKCDDFWDCKQQKLRGDISEFEEVFTGALNDYLIEHEKAKEEDLDRSALIAQLEEILEKLLK